MESKDNLHWCFIVIQGLCPDGERIPPTIFMCETEDPTTCRNAEYTRYEDNHEDGLAIINIKDDRFNITKGYYRF